MKAIVYSETGDADVLRLIDREMPEPGADEVRVRIVVSGVNPTDWKSRRGNRGVVETDTIPGQDGAGVIDAVGPGVTAFAVGDRVWTVIAAWQRPHGGTAQEYALLPVSRVYPLGDASFDIGASLGVPAVTAHRTLTVGEDLPDRLAPGSLAGRTVLVQGGAGAVGHAAIQLAHWAGATVITTVSGPEKAALAQAAGADHVLNYRESDVATLVRDIAPDGVDVIVELAASNSALDSQVLRVRGTIAIYATDGGTTFPIEVLPNMSLNARYQFVLLYTIGQESIDAAAADIVAALADGALEVGEAAGLPLHRFTLENTAHAHRAVEDAVVGKVLIDVTPA